MTPAYKQGWNDRICGRNFKFFVNRDGALAANFSTLAQDLAWPDTAKREYVQGWDDAETKIASFEIQG